MGRRQIVRLGTRGSPLALRQTELMVAALRRSHPAISFEIVVVETEGDRVRDRPLSHFGDKGVFVRAIERALLDGSVDLAVHSLKDVPGDATTLGLELAAFSPREDPHDVLVSADGATLDTLPEGARIGTSSPRRRVQLLSARRDLTPLDIRGNVDTRLRKLRERQYDAIILAAAGLRRLGLSDAITEELPFDRFVPDAGQGIMAIQARAGEPAARIARGIDDPQSRAVASAERAVVRALGADCRTPAGAYATMDGDVMVLRSMAAGRDGIPHHVRREGPAGDPVSLGQSVAAELLAALRSDSALSDSALKEP